MHYRARPAIFAMNRVIAAADAGRAECNQLLNPTAARSSYLLIVLIAQPVDRAVPLAAAAALKGTSHPTRLPSGHSLP
jgi:hypothetical protein